MFSADDIVLYGVKPALPARPSWLDLANYKVRESDAVQPGHFKISRTLRTVFCREAADLSWRIQQDFATAKLRDDIDQQFRDLRISLGLDAYMEA